MEQNQAFVQLLPDLGQAGCSATVLSSPVGKPFCWKNHRLIFILLLEMQGKNLSPPQLCCCVFLTVVSFLLSFGYLKSYFLRKQSE